MKSRIILNIAYKILKPREKFKILNFVFLYFFLGVLDFLGVITIGVIVGLATSDESGLNITQLIIKLFENMGINNISQRKSMLILMFTVVTFFLVKTIISIKLVKNNMLLMAHIATNLSSNLVDLTLNNPKYYLNSDSSHKRIYAATRGVDYLVLFVLAPTIILVADSLILVMFIIGLILIDPILTMILLVIFASLSLFSYIKLNKKSGTLGSDSAKLNIEIYEKISEAYDIYRELIVRNARSIYVEKISDLRNSLSKKTAEFNLIPYVGKYLIEVTIIITVFILASVQFFVQENNSGLTKVLIFLVALTRIAPTILRIQQGSVTIKGSLGMAHPTLNLIKELNVTEDHNKVEFGLTDISTSFNPKIELKSIYFQYGTSSKFQIIDLNLTVNNGDRLAIVGPSGSGKSTIIDIMLGILEPNAGSVLISDLAPKSCFSKWKGYVAYVPQEVKLIRGTILDNLMLGLALRPAAELVENAIKKAGLHEFILLQPHGLDTLVDADGQNLSFGEKQRLGIARSLLTKPKIIIFDEATSSLDGINEDIIMRTIMTLDKDITVIVIAHRISTIKEFERIIYVKNGRIEGEGNFGQLRSRNPEFDKQAKLMGL